MRILLVFIFIALAYTGNSQEEPTSIKVRKEQTLVKAYFDNVGVKLLAVDKYGNPKDSKILSFKLWIKGRDGFLQGHTNNLDGEMLKELNKPKKAVKIFFTEITAEDEDGHAVKLPDLIEVWFPDCKNCDGVGKKRK